MGPWSPPADDHFGLERLVTSERYDLIIPEAHFDTPEMKCLLDVIRSEAFAERVEELGGYATSQTGKLL